MWGGWASIQADCGLCFTKQQKILLKILALLAMGYCVLEIPIQFCYVLCGQRSSTAGMWTVGSSKCVADISSHLLQHSRLWPWLFFTVEVVWDFTSSYASFSISLCGLPLDYFVEFSAFVIHMEDLQCVYGQNYNQYCRVQPDTGILEGGILEFLKGDYWNPWKENTGIL